MRALVNIKPLLAAIEVPGRESPDRLVTPSLVISLCALGFAIGSFWWIQVRRSGLHAYPPRTYAATFEPDTHISLPIVLHNPGAAPIVLRDLKLLVSDGGTAPDRVGALTLPWAAIQPGLEPAPVDGGRVMPSPIVVNGRQMVETFIEFSSKRTLELVAGPHTLEVQALLGHRRRWTTLLVFDLHTELVRGTGGPFIVRSNDPDWSMD